MNNNGGSTRLRGGLRAPPGEILYDGSDFSISLSFFFRHLPSPDICEAFAPLKNNIISLWSLRTLSPCKIGDMELMYGYHLNNNFNFRQWMESCGSVNGWPWRGCGTECTMNQQSDHLSLGPFIFPVCEALSTAGAQRSERPCLFSHLLFRRSESERGQVVIDFSEQDLAKKIYPQMRQWKGGVTVDLTI